MIPRILLSGSVCLAAAFAPLPAAAEIARPYLNWPGKTVRSVAPPADIPPSPYGPVGQPYTPPPAPEPAPEPVPAPVPAPVVVAPQAAAPVAPPPKPAAPDAPFVVPSTSKYAGRVSAPVPQAAAPEAVQAEATAPEPGEPLIVPENDPVFVPGMRVTDPATQSPRYYSLHRAYGLPPDPVETRPLSGELSLDPGQVETKD